MSESSTPSHDEELIGVGIIRRPHGIRGEASVEAWTNSLERFASLETVLLLSPDRTERKTVRIDSSRIHGDRVLVHFEGIDTPEEIRELQKWTIEIPDSEAVALDEGEYFLHDLVGLEILDRVGASLGKVIGANEGGGGVLLSVRRGNGREFDLPFAAEICTEVDLKARTVRVSLPAGLEDLDSPETVEPVSSLKVEEIRQEPRRATPTLRIDVITIFPGMFNAVVEGIIGKAVERNVLQIKIWDLRDFTTDRHRSTDDQAYGGGAGMVMLAEPIFRCVEAIRGESTTVAPHVVMMSPQGKSLNQKAAERLSATGWLILLCGRYEGIDERVRESIVDEELSVGDFVVSGGELPAMLLIDAVSRLVEGVVGQRASVEADSFYNGLLDYPHYTRPAELRGQKVPEVLLSGHAENIRKWRKKESLRATLLKRPDLLEQAPLDEEARAILDELKKP